MFITKMNDFYTMVSCFKQQIKLLYLKSLIKETSEGNYINKHTSFTYLYFLIEINLNFGENKINLSFLNRFDIFFLFSY